HSYAGCSGCWGSCHGCWGSSYGCWGAGYGCYGCMGCYGVYTGPVMTPAGNPMQAPPATGGSTPPGKSAQLIIEKPVDAKIVVDNQPVKSEGTTQTFGTPA